MDPIEKLKSDIQYWRAAIEKSKQTLKIGEPILESLESNWEALTDKPLPKTFSVKMVHEVSQDEAGLELSGECSEQIEQALKLNSPQSSKELDEFLKEHGTEFSRGAISYGIRELREEGKIREVKKVGNLRYYEYVPEEERRTKRRTKAAFE